MPLHLSRLESNTSKNCHVLREYVKLTLSTNYRNQRLGDFSDIYAKQVQ